MKEDSRHTVRGRTARARLVARRRCKPGLARCVGSALIASLALAGVACLPSLAAGTEKRYEVDADTGYRMERYRAPVPDSVPGAITLDDAQVKALHATGQATFIDVYPPRGLGADPLDGHWILSESHQTIPGATWLPEVGRGHLEQEHLDYLTRNLERLTGGDRAHPLVYFCTADCWQSWNASRRSALMGYTAVHWYPHGTDGWRDVGGELEPAVPLNFLDDSR